ncbi:hypothetical protein [Actinomadura rudentiformis]|uniref:Uncharacterized protein n=1 Tax=Actinomadura rudentiformis TaxID=359158 RepID=A0A6H9YJR8_9ACTN|nr:hypothetical protein [Actinomadura rudentiformis]KAB2347245.1 hypothetical protein F8566_19670 [Actinomadura rudentiformis]
MVKIRLTGLPAEVQDAADRIAAVVAVLETSRPYPRRGNSRLVSLYLEADVSTPPTPGDADTRPSDSNK